MASEFVDDGSPGCSKRPKMASLNTLHASVADRMDPHFAEVYQKYQVGRPRADQVPYDVYSRDRASFAFPTGQVAAPGPEVQSSEVYEVPVSNPPGTIEVQVYVPTPEAIEKGGLQKDGRLPVYLNYHGGGFVIGGLRDDEPLCRKLCQGVGCVVANVAYRLAPEHPHPTAAMDGYDALVWVMDNDEALKIDRNRVAVGGLSAGGCIAAAVSLMNRNFQATGGLPPLVLQLLIVPVIDARFVPVDGAWNDKSVVPYESYITNEFAPMLPLARLVWFYNLWLGTDESRGQRASEYTASPITSPSHANLPPASIHCAEIDPLLSEGQAYHQKLIKDGTRSDIKIYKGQGHPFNQWDGAVPAAREYVDNCVEALRGAFSTTA